MYKRARKRTTLSLEQVIYELAQENMQVRGFNGNFSGYVAELIRQDLAGLTPGQRLLLREAPRSKK